METIIKVKKIKDPKYNNSSAYNKEYYNKHKKELLEILNTKCLCDLCFRTVSKQRMRQHKETVLCLKNRKPVEDNQDHLMDIEQEIRNIIYAQC
jgi:hypothetical protein